MSPYAAVQGAHLDDVLAVGLAADVLDVDHDLARGLDGQHVLGDHPVLPLPVTGHRVLHQAQDDQTSAALRRERGESTTLV